MIVLIAGGTHVGKTTLAQKLLEKYHFPYLSIDHLKMGLIRSDQCKLSPESDDKELTEYLWPIVREMIKTAIENHQNLIIEGVYIPFDFKKDFDDIYLKKIYYICIIFSKDYILNNYSDIKKYASVTEMRIKDSTLTKENLMDENIKNLEQCQKYELDYVLIEKYYQINLDFFRKIILK